MINEKGSRRYKTTHPWINFVFDANDLNYRAWLLLGEAKSKCDHIKGAPLLPDVNKSFHGVYLAKGALATTAIEGNTLTEDEVKKRIEGDLKLPPSKEYLGQEIDNIVAAYNQIGKKILSNESANLSVEEIKNYNRLILKNLPLSEEVTPGKIRTYSVGVAGYRGAPPEDCEYLLKEYVNWLNHNFLFPKEDIVIYGILKAILAHLYLVWIHPFGDGNGRTARLIEFQILLSLGVPDVAAHLLSNHYNMTRTEYYRQLELTSKPDGKISNFVLYALQGFVDGLKAEIDQIQQQQLMVHWINHVHNSFRGRNRKEDDRRKELALELACHDEIFVPISGIKYISTKVMEKYSNLSEKTIRRDVDLLIELDLLVKEKDRIRCKWEILRSYMTKSKKTA